MRIISNPHAHIVRKGFLLKHNLKLKLRLRQLKVTCPKSNSWETWTSNWGWSNSKAQRVPAATLPLSRQLGMFFFFYFNQEIQVSSSPKVFTEKPQEATREIQGIVAPLEEFSISVSLSRSDSYIASLKNSRRQSEFGPKWTFLEVELCELNAFCVYLFHMPFHCQSYNKNRKKKKKRKVEWSLEVHGFNQPHVVRNINYPALGWPVSCSQPSTLLSSFWLFARIPHSPSPSVWPCTRKPWACCSNQRICCRGWIWAFHWGWFQKQCRGRQKACPGGSLGTCLHSPQWRCSPVREGK